MRGQTLISMIPGGETTFESKKGRKLSFVVPAFHKMNSGLNACTQRRHPFTEQIIILFFCLSFTTHVFGI